jgi:CBS domain containing-hemolysin-like protein
VASVLAVTALTYLHIVLGEMIPKTLALQHAQATALWVSTPMRWIKVALWPLVIGLNTLSFWMLRALGIRRDTKVGAPNSETIRFALGESISEGKIGPEAGAVLQELLEFSDLTAGEVMTPRVRIVGLQRGASAEELGQALSTAPHTRYPVFDGTIDTVTGLVLTRDLFGLLVDRRPLEDALVRPVPFVPETLRLDAVLARMRKERSNLVIVMDEHGGTSGLLTAEDLFEEIIGEISDNPSEPQPLVQVAGALQALGVARLDEVGEQLGLDLEHPEVDTVSGLVLTLLGRPPVPGDRVTWRGVQFQVQSVQGHGVQTCTLEPDPDKKSNPQA